MISVLVNNFSLNENLNESYLNDLVLKYDDIEFFLLNDSNSFDSSYINNKQINVVDDYDDFIINSNGEYVLFLDSSHEILSIINEIEHKMVNNNLDMLIYLKYGKYHFDEYLNKPLTNFEIDLKFLFKNLNSSFSLFIKKSFLKINRINIFEDKSLFLLNCICLSDIFMFMDGQFKNESINRNNTDKFNISEYYEVINNALSNKRLYENYLPEFWNYIFGKIFELIYNLRNESIKRNYFYESKILFDKYCFDEGYYNDIYNNVDIMVLEFFKQSLIDVCYIPKKRETIQRLINKNFKPLSISIKSNNYNINYEQKFRKCLEKKGFKVRIDKKENWYNQSSKDDIVLVFRNIDSYNPNENVINVIWNINNENISIDEYDGYDVVFISSKEHTNVVNKNLDGVVKQLKFNKNDNNTKINFNCDMFIETLRNITF